MIVFYNSVNFEVIPTQNYKTPLQKVKFAISLKTIG